MKSNVSTLQDLLKSIIDIQFTTIKIEQSNRSECTWLIGLTDFKGEPPLNYISYENEAEAKKVIEYLLEKYNNVERGEDFGKLDGKIFLYFKCS